VGSITAPDAIVPYLLQQFQSFNWLQEKFDDEAYLRLNSTAYGKFWKKKLQFFLVEK
jgi:hypothetical protein